MISQPTLTLNNDVEMPLLGLGVYQSAKQEAVAAVRTALSDGYRLIDTAAGYFNEAEVGEGIRTSGVDAKDVFVTTKLWMSDYGYDEALHAFDRSLGKLRLDQLGLYLLHWPVPADFERTIASYKAAERLLADGRVRAIGVCNFSEADLERLIDNVAVVPAVNQIELHPYFNQHALRAVHQRFGIVTQAWSPIGGINVYASKGPNVLEDPTITALAKRYGKTSAQIVLRWHVERGTSAVPKSVRAERIAENISIFDFALTADDIASIDALDTDERSGPDPDTVNQQSFDLVIED
ncbi:aldo/keto reductase [Sphingomonas phyllosphaerae]|uniref:aldo/keto reductase n=1 Tax=Sphingomonas phyllosphaerae TaxID=257003 RepID=UPI00241330BF|nr:aldo/keto reductase [Sphingomonas phyllosphaerae]